MGSNARSDFLRNGALFFAWRSTPADGKHHADERPSSSWREATRSSSWWEKRYVRRLAVTGGEAYSFLFASVTRSRATSSFTAFRAQNGAKFVKAFSTTQTLPSWTREASRTTPTGACRCKYSACIAPCQEWRQFSWRHRVACNIDARAHKKQVTAACRCLPVCRQASPAVLPGLLPAQGNAAAVTLRWAGKWRQPIIGSECVQSWRRRREGMVSNQSQGTWDVRQPSSTCFKRRLHAFTV